VTVSDFEALLSGTRRQLATLHEAKTIGPPPVSAIGTALDGMIVAEMSADGRLARLTLDRAALRLEGPDLAREIVAAVNTAWARRMSAGDAAQAALGIDPVELQRELTELQDRGLDTMRHLLGSLRATVDRIERSTAR
jgi:hypothetical protein